MIPSQSPAIPADVIIPDLGEVVSDPLTLESLIPGPERIQQEAGLPDISELLFQDGAIALDILEPSPNSIKMQQSVLSLHHMQLNDSTHIAIGAALVIDNPPELNLQSPTELPW